MSFWATVSNIHIADLGIFQEICEKNKLRWENVQNGDVIAKVHDENAGGPAYRRYMEVINDQGKNRIMVDNDAKYSSITARFGANGGTLVRDYTTATLQKKYNRLGARTTSRVLDNNWIELRVAVGGGR